MWLRPRCGIGADVKKIELVYGDGRGRNDDEVDCQDPQILPEENRPR